MKLFTTLVIAAISIVPAIAFTSTSLVHHHAHTSVKLDMSTRREVFLELGSGLAIIGSAAKPAIAETVTVGQSSAQVEDNEIVKEQRTVVDKLDINNAAVADYMEFPGMYPRLVERLQTMDHINQSKMYITLRVCQRQRLLRLRNMRKS